MFLICENGVVAALKDELLARPAMMKHIEVLHQQFEKLENAGESEVLAKFSVADLRGLKALRNISAHDYDSLQTERLEAVIRHDLPRLKEQILRVMESESFYK